MDIEELMKSKFRCVKCGGTVCVAKEVAMTGTGLSKIFDIQHNHYLFVSCTNCGYVEVYNPDILRGKKSGELGSIMDLLFG
ncbi:MAG: zinc ribbon domain-containing protein [Thermicanus sp.]|nr:zinc ribbon domain-containing protein [Thermicanus sp.]